MARSLIVTDFAIIQRTNCPTPSFWPGIMRNEYAVTYAVFLHNFLRSPSKRRLYHPWLRSSHG